jgi:hypothetical protein
VLQRQIVTTTSATSNTTTTEAATGLTDTISLLDVGSKVRVLAACSVVTRRGANLPTQTAGYIRLWRTAVTSGSKLTDYYTGANVNFAAPTIHDRVDQEFTLLAEDGPATKSATTYVVGVTSTSTDVNICFNAFTQTMTMILEEIAT